MFKQLILLLCLAPTTLWAQTVTPLPDSGGLLVNITEKGDSTAVPRTR